MESKFPHRQGRRRRGLQEEETTEDALPQGNAVIRERSAQEGHGSNDDAHERRSNAAAALPPASAPTSLAAAKTGTERVVAHGAVNEDALPAQEATMLAAAKTGTEPVMVQGADYDNVAPLQQPEALQQPGAIQVGGINENDSDRSSNFTSNGQFETGETQQQPPHFHVVAAVAVDENAERANRMRLQNLENMLLQQQQNIAQATVVDGDVVSGSTNSLPMTWKCAMGVCIILLAVTGIIFYVVLSRQESSATSGPTPGPSGPTSGPTLAPTLLSRADALLQRLEPITPADLLLNPLAPQGAAFTWLLEQDTSTDPTTYPTLEQRYALVVLFFSTQGQYWQGRRILQDRISWLSPVHECSWYSVVCNPTNSLVTAIEMMGNNLVGTIPSELGTLYSVGEKHDDQLHQVVCCA